MMRRHKIGSILRKWAEKHDGVTWYYVEHMLDGKIVLSYSSYADPDDSNASPPAIASSLETSETSPFVVIDLEEKDAAQ